jgi:DNA-binding XRE family transcriptional regulator
MIQTFNVIRDGEEGKRILKQIRTKMGWSQQKMANLCGVTMNTYSRWERGEIRCPALFLMVTTEEFHELVPVVTEHAAFG